MGKPKSDGRFPEMSRQDSPPLSLRITSQCFCMNSTSGREGCIARRCTQCPTSASGSGISSDCRLIGRQVWPASSERNAPAAEIAAYIRPCCSGSSRIVCRHIPPAPGCQEGPDSWPRSSGSSCQLCPPSSERTARRPRPRRTPRRGRPATAPGARPARTPTGAESRRTTGGCREFPGTRTGSPPAPRSRRRRRTAGSPALTSRWTATRTAGRGRQAGGRLAHWIASIMPASASALGSEHLDLACWLENTNG
jgi:hypothetical protein